MYVREQEDARERLTLYIEKIKDWASHSNANSVLHVTSDRERWKGMGVDAITHDTLERETESSRHRYVISH